MSRRDEKVLSLATHVRHDVEGGDLSNVFRQRLSQGIHGVGFSPYKDGQEPGHQVCETEVRERMDIVRPHVKWVRSFSCTEGNEFIPVVAKEHGIKTLVGAWLSDDREKNEVEIQSLIDLARQGNVDIAAVGNEVLYRNELNEQELIDYITRVKQALPDIPVGYVDAYYEFENRPALTDSCDVVLANCYPFWEGCQIDYATLYMKDMYRRAQRAGKGKKVIITETGWPNTGQSFHGAIPSQEGAIRYFLDAQQWSKEEEIDLFYFSSFDETWKTSMEGDVGAYWGLWDKDRQLKYQQTR